MDGDVELDNDHSDSEAGPVATSFENGNMLGVSGLQVSLFNSGSRGASFDHHSVSLPGLALRVGDTNNRLLLL